MNDFDRLRDEFDKDWEKAERAGKAGAILGVLFVVWFMAVLTIVVIWTLVKFS